MRFRHSFVQIIALLLTLGSGTAGADTLSLSRYAERLLETISGDPIVLLPQRAPMPPLAGTWAAQVIDRLLEIHSEASAHSTGEAGQIAFKLRRSLNLVAARKIPYFYAPVMQLIGPPDRLVSFQITSAPDAKLHKSVSELCAPEINAEDETTCMSAVEKRLHVAVIRWTLGDREGSREIVAEIEANRDIARLLSRSGDGRWFCVDKVDGDYRCGASVQEPWFFFLVQSGDIDRAMAVLLDWERRSNAPGITDYDAQRRSDIVASATEILLQEGRIRDAALLYKTMVAHPEYQTQGNIRTMLQVIDQQIGSAAPEKVPTAILKLLTSTTPNFGAMPAESFDQLATAIDCRAAHVGVYARGDAEAVAEFDRLASRYVSSSEDSFETGYCLARLAARMDRADAAVTIRKKIDAFRKLGMEDRRKAVRAAIAESRRAGNDRWRLFEAMLPAIAAIMAAPDAPLLLDRTEFTKSLSTWLEATKKIPSPDQRGDAGSMLIDKILWHFRMTAAQ